ncbi:hypothetical protein BDV11DRAFT_183010, partial [Aspergillus similis]
MHRIAPRSQTLPCACPALPCPCPVPVPALSLPCPCPPLRSPLGESGCGCDSHGRSRCFVSPAFLMLRCLATTYYLLQSAICSLSLQRFTRIGRGLATACPSGLRRELAYPLTASEV